MNQEYAAGATQLKSDDEVALLPPVSGGTGESETESHASIVRTAIETSRILANIKRGEDGAAVVFEGIVRNQTRGRKTLYLDYEAYEEMALQQMERLAEQARKQFQIRDVALVHRLGRLEIGETSVLIVVASAHRAAAFDACRWLIDTLKRTVPIWKKEYFEDGAVWADGEAFPAEIRRLVNSRGRAARAQTAHLSECRGWSAKLPAERVATLDRAVYFLFRMRKFAPLMLLLLACAASPAQQASAASSVDEQLFLHP